MREHCKWDLTVTNVGIYVCASYVWPQTDMRATSLFAAFTVDPPRSGRSFSLYCRFVAEISCSSPLVLLMGKSFVVSSDHKFEFLCSGSMFFDAANDKSVPTWSTHICCRKVSTDLGYLEFAKSQNGNVFFELDLVFDTFHIFVYKKC